MKTVSFGVIGTNFVSDWFCEAVGKTEGAALGAVYSRTAEKGGEFAKKHGIPAVYTDLEAFFSSPIDAVYIASPNFLHVPQALTALEHGKHVLAEKPAALTEEDFVRLAEEAKKRELVYMEAMRPAHDPALGVIREAVAKIGTVRRAVFDFCQYSSRYDRFRSGEVLNAFRPELGNAALMDIGVYALHCCVALFGAPRKVLSSSVLLENGFEGMGDALLVYDGMQAEVSWSKITESVTPSFIIGEDGAVLIGKLSTLESASLKMRGGEETVLFSDRSEQESNMVHEVRDFAAAARGEYDVSRQNENTRATLAVMDKIRCESGIVFPVQ